MQADDEQLKTSAARDLRDNLRRGKRRRISHMGSGPRPRVRTSQNRYPSAIHPIDHPTETQDEAPTQELDDRGDKNPIGAQEASVDRPSAHPEIPQDRVRTTDKESCYAPVVTQIRAI